MNEKKKWMRILSNEVSALINLDVLKTAKKVYLTWGSGFKLLINLTPIVIGWVQI